MTDLVLFGRALRVHETDAGVVLRVEDHTSNTTEDEENES